MAAVAPVNDLPLIKAKQRRVARDAQPAVLADIYQEDVNIAIWQREGVEELCNAARAILEAKPGLRLSAVVGPENAYEALRGALGKEKQFAPLTADIVELVDMFCCMFELNSVGLRLTSLQHAMCPRFHVDMVPCRLVTTYYGDATEWLTHDFVDRRKLGLGNEGLPDDKSGLFSNISDINKLWPGEIALLKGEGWAGNDEAGLVHRSPQLKTDSPRLLLTIDFTSQSEA